jgi:1-acyl-sn-glycerol-3-phosphate acyltransferase
MVDSPGHSSRPATGAFRRLLMGNPAARVVLSIWSWLALGIIVVVWLPLTFVVWVVTMPFDKPHYWTGFVFRRLCVVHQWLNPMWKFRTSGVKVADPRHPYVVVSNHESFVDMLLISHLPWEMKWLSKESILKIPVVGQLMRMAGDIKLVRGDKSSIVKAMAECSRVLDNGVSVMLFPEGTRTRDGSLGEFKDGAFRLAIEHQVPILPLVVDGTRTALHADGWLMNVTDAEVRVLEPIPTTGMTSADIGTLRDRVRGIIGDELAAMRG